jgi:hypothetical protein
VAEFVDESIATLTLSPAVVNQQTPFEVIATLSGPASQEIVVPLRFRLGGGPEFVWMFSHLGITPGHTAGSLMIDPQMLVTGQVIWIGSLGGESRSAVVTIT